MGRKDAERLLLVPGNQRGTFLARESETTKGRKIISMSIFISEWSVAGQAKKINKNLSAHEEKLLIKDGRLLTASQHHTEFCR